MYNFKGSGFYITDYKNKKTTATPAAGASTPKSTGKDKSGSTSETKKPAVKKQEQR